MEITSARIDAAAIVDKVCAQLGRNIPCASRDRLFPWAPEENFAEWTAAIKVRASKLQIDTESIQWLIRRHGKRVSGILNDIENNPSLAERLISTVPLIYADLLFCARHEMVVHLDDLLRRRLPLLILAKLKEAELHRLAFFVSVELDWDDDTINREIASCFKRAS